MQTLKESLKTIALSLVALSLIGVAYAWTEPNQNPPNPAGGSTPINTSSTAQIKAGNLQVNAIVTSAASGNALIVPSGNVGIGTADPGTSRLKVAGELKADWIHATAPGVNTFAGDVVVANGGGITLGGVKKTAWPQATASESRIFSLTYECHAGNNQSRTCNFNFANDIGIGGLTYSDGSVIQSSELSTHSPLIHDTGSDGGGGCLRVTVLSATSISASTSQGGGRFAIIAIADKGINHNSHQSGYSEKCW